MKTHKSPSHGGFSPAASERPSLCWFLERCGWGLLLLLLLLLLLSDASLQTSSSCFRLNSRTWRRRNTETKRRTFERAAGQLVTDRFPSCSSKHTFYQQVTTNKLQLLLRTFRWNEEEKCSRVRLYLRAISSSVTSVCIRLTSSSSFSSSSFGFIRAISFCDEDKMKKTIQRFKWNVVMIWMFYFETSSLWHFYSRKHLHLFSEVKHWKHHVYLRVNTCSLQTNSFTIFVAQKHLKSKSSSGGKFSVMKTFRL